MEKTLECQMEFLSMGRDLSSTTLLLYLVALIMKQLKLIQVSFSRPLSNIENKIFCYILLPFKGIIT